MEVDGETVSVTDAYRHASERLRVDFVPLMLIVIALAAISVVAAALQGVMPGIIGFSVQIFVVGPISFGAGWAMLRSVRGQDPSLSDLFVPFDRCFAQSAFGYLLIVVALTAGFSLLILPGILLAVRLAFVPFLVVDEDMDAISAFRESWRRTGAYPWQIFWAMALAIPIIALGLLALFVVF